MATTLIKEDKFNFLSFKGKYKILHMTWFAFFLSVFAWFSFAPFATTIQKALGLTTGQLKTLFICNVALTIPARIIIGMLVDRFGPRKTFSSLLFIMGIPCFLFAWADTFTELVVYRLILGCLGAGFVIGIRIIGEWFSPRQIGVAEGIYGGWGNWGSAIAAFTLPSLALFFSEVHGWRLAIGLTGALCMGFSPLYYLSVRDTPAGKTYFKPKKITAMEISNYRDLFALIGMQFPMVICLSVLTWKLQLPSIGFISPEVAYGIYGILAMMLLSQVYQIVVVNQQRLRDGIHMVDRYRFKQVAILDLAYAVSFGSELAVISVLPLFFETSYGLSVTQAGLIASCFAGLNFITRPSGGLLSDKFGRKGVMLILMEWVT